MTTIRSALAILILAGAWRLKEGRRRSASAATAADQTRATDAWAAARLRDTARIVEGEIALAKMSGALRFEPRSAASGAIRLNVNGAIVGGMADRVKATADEVSALAARVMHAESRLSALQADVHRKA